MWQSAYGKDCQNIQLQHKVTFSLTHLKEEEIGYSGKALVVVGDLTDHQQVVCRTRKGPRTPATRSYKHARNLINSMYLDSFFIVEQI